jgi:hypothetical protein
VRAASDTDAAEWLTPEENARLLQAAGITSPAFREVTTVEDAVRTATEFGRPVAVKVISPTIVHKTDVGGVALDLATSEAVRAACNDMAERLGDAVEGFFVQEMVREGTEVLLGITSDPTFGALVAFGLGGTAVEVLQDVSFRVTPLTDVDAADLLRNRSEDTRCWRRTGDALAPTHRLSKTWWHGSPGWPARCRRSTRWTSTRCGSLPTARGLRSSTSAPP